MVRALTVALLLLANAAVFAADLSVKLDRTTLFADESLVLRVQLSNAQFSGEFNPEFKDFDILQRSQGSQLQLINGKRSQSVTWELLLAPKKAGNLVVPAFTLGGEQSQAKMVTVKPSASRPKGSNEQELFLRVSVTEEAPYVQQQVVYSMRIYQAQPIAGGNVTEPTHPDVDMERLGLDRSFIENVGGRKYNVIERRYALFAQKSGKITLPAVRLDTRVPAGRQSNGFFGARTRPIRVVSDEITLDVQGVPNTYTAPWWLAASQLRGTASWEPQTTAVGQPITLEVKIEAVGVLPSQLPVLDEPQITNVRLYPDGSRAGKTATADDVVSQRVMRWTVIPEAPGTLQVAPFVMQWWNLKTNKRETLEISVPPLAVEGTVGNTSNTNQNVLNGSVEQDKEAPKPISAEEETTDERSTDSSNSVLGFLGTWQGLVVAGFLVAAAGLLIRRRSRNPVSFLNMENRASPDAALVLLAEAVTRADSHAARDALLDWASGTFDQEIRSLPQLSERIEDSSLEELLMDLDAICYREKTRWEGGPLLEKVKRYKHSARIVTIESLPPLS